MADTSIVQPTVQATAPPAAAQSAVLTYLTNGGNNACDRFPAVRQLSNYLSTSAVQKCCVETNLCVSLDVVCVLVSVSVVRWFVSLLWNSGLFRAPYHRNLAADYGVTERAAHPIRYTAWWCWLVQLTSGVVYVSVSAALAGLLTPFVATAMSKLNNSSATQCSVCDSWQRLLLLLPQNVLLPLLYGRTPAEGCVTSMMSHVAAGVVLWCGAVASAWIPAALWSQRPLTLILLRACLELTLVVITALWMSRGACSASA